MSRIITTVLRAGRVAVAPGIFKFIGSLAGPLLAACILASCAGAPDLSPADQPLSKTSLMQLGRKGMDPKAPIFVRIFKEESELEVWKERTDGRYYHFKTYPICNWSGALGPKLRQGDKQAPEGFYQVKAYQMNPNSSFHVSFNLGYPNAYDKARGRTGNFLMVHGKCASAGCYAMTDALMEEIYALAREAFAGGQEAFHVHAYPFRMTDANMQRHEKHRWVKFWQTLKEGYDHFDYHRIPPNVAVCQRKYVVNVNLPADRNIDPKARCPRFERPLIEPFVPQPSDQQIASERIAVPGPKTRTVADIAATKQIGLDPLPTAYGLGGPKGEATRSRTSAAGSESIMSSVSKYFGIE